MVEISNLVTPSPEWWDVAIKGMRNAFKSGDKSDSMFMEKRYPNTPVYVEGYYWNGQDVWNIVNVDDDIPKEKVKRQLHSDEYNKLTNATEITGFYLGEDDKELLINLCKSGTSHRKVLRQLPVIMDITAPLYWWKQMDQYKLGTVTNSESTMNTIMKDEFHEDDFSFNNLYPEEEHEIVQNFNNIRTRYLKAVEEDVPSASKRAWEQLIELLPQSYNQKRTWTANYEVLLNIIKQRKDHKLKEWNDFIEYLLKNVPYLEEIAEAID